MLCSLEYTADGKNIGAWNSEITGRLCNVTVP
jgi:hypothetical protein